MQESAKAAHDLVTDLKAFDAIGAAVRDAMAAGYRQGWDDATIAHKPDRWRFFKPSKPATDRARDLLAEDWVPAEADTFVRRVHVAITDLLIGRHRRRAGLGIVVGPPEIHITGSAAAGMILDEIAIDDIARQAAEGGRH